MKTLKLAGILAVGAVAIAPGAFAASLNVFVGYADNLRASGFFPGPWIGSTFNGQTVISQTNPAGIIFDSGAVRIDNTDSAPLVISNFRVTTNAGANVFAIWGSGVNLTLAAGQSGIFTQFPNNGQNFDSSDQGLFGSTPPVNLEPNNAAGNGNTNLIGGCSSNPSFFTASEAITCAATNAPVISFLANGTAVSFVDSGFILNTGEWDFVNNNLYGEDGNESINWNSLGGTSRSGNTPEPSTVLLFGSGLAITGMLFRRRSLNRG